MTEMHMYIAIVLNKMIVSANVFIHFQNTLNPCVTFIEIERIG